MMSTWATSFTRATRCHTSARGMNERRAHLIFCVWMDESMAATAPSSSDTVLMPHTSVWLPTTNSNDYKCSPLWGVHVFHLLDQPTCEQLIELAETHGATHGWSTGRHKHFPTTDIAVTPDNAPEIYNILQPWVKERVLPALAFHFGRFDATKEMSMADMFLVKCDHILQASNAHPHL